MPRGGAGPGGPPGTFLKSCRRSPQVRQSCHIRLWSKRWALVCAKRHFWCIRLFGAGPPINLSKFGKTYCAKNVEGITRTVIRAPREFKTRNWWFQYRPEFVESIPKMAISEFIAGIGGIGGSGSWAAIRNLPSTRAGGQDDVSSEGNSLKTYI